MRESKKMETSESSKSNESKKRKRNYNAKHEHRKLREGEMRDHNFWVRSQNVERDERIRRRNETKIDTGEHEPKEGSHQLQNEPPMVDDGKAVAMQHSEGDRNNENDSNYKNDTDEIAPVEIFSLKTMYPHEYPDVVDPLMAYKAVADPDVM